MVQLYHGHTRKSRTVFEAFGHAMRGIFTALILERNARIQFSLALLAVVLWYVLQLSQTQLVVILLTMTAIITMELLNSSLEALADAVHPEYDERIQRSKDMAAGAVLLVSSVAGIILMTIFFPPLVTALGTIFV